MYTQSKTAGTADIRQSIPHKENATFALAVIGILQCQLMKDFESASEAEKPCMAYANKFLESQYDLLQKTVES